jgi:threonine dehydrogenase-like Zn-dependent dehydrogenase
MVLERIAACDISTEHLATHILPLDKGPQGYTMFKNKDDGCIRAVFQPGP